MRRFDFYFNQSKFKRGKNHPDTACHPSFVRRGVFCFFNTKYFLGLFEGLFADVESAKVLWFASLFKCLRFFVGTIFCGAHSRQRTDHYR